MLNLLEEYNIKGVLLNNRLVRSATDEGLADANGFPSEKLFRLYRRLAKGGVGLIITGFTFVAEGGQPIFPGTMGIHTDEHIDVYRNLVDTVHDNGARIAMQLAHAGRQTSSQRIGGQTPMAPSGVTDPFYGTTPREMTAADIEQIIDAFAKAARRARQSGFDAVQIHCAHGYLLSQFTNPHTNRRTDRWGGSLDNRLRIVKEIVQRCRDRVGADYPILVKYSAWDRLPGGIDLDEGVEMGVQLAHMGIDGIEVSCGLAEDGGSTVLGLANLGEPIRQGYNRRAASLLKARVDVPVLVVGGLTDPKVMEEILVSGDADLICLSRALIADPNFPSQIDEARMEPARCIQCSLCMLHLAQAPMRCYFGKQPEA